MYGIIILTVKDLVLKKYSLKEWEKICAEAKLPLDYTPNKAYDDQVLLDLVFAASKLLNIPVNELIEAAGYWFIVYIRNTSYGKLLTVMGTTLPEVLNNINNLHAHLLKVAHFPEITSPTFRCSHVKDDSLLLHYTPGRVSRGSIYCPLVVGLVKALGDDLGIKDLVVKQVKSKAKGDEEDVFRVRWVPQYDDDEDPGSESSNTSSVTSKKPKNDRRSLKVDGGTLLRLFPFHIIFDKTMAIQQIGPSLLKVTDIELDDKMSQHFTIQSPEGVTFQTYRSLEKKSTTDVFVMQYKAEDGPPIQFEGELVHIKKRKIFFFACVPLLNSLEEAQKLGLSLQDFALGDKASKLSMLLSNAREQQAHLREAEEQQKAKKEKNAGGGLLVSIRNRTRAKPRKSVSQTSAQATNGPDVEETLFSLSLPSQRSRKESVSTPEAQRLKSPAPQRAHTAGVCPFPLSNGVGSSKATNNQQKKSNIESEIKETTLRIKVDNDKIHEMLSGDAWNGFPLTMALLEIAISKGDEGVFDFVVEYYYSTNKVDLLLQTSFTDEINKSIATGVAFRESSIATLLFSSYTDRIATGYLEGLIAPLIQQVSQLEEALELDESRKQKGKYSQEFCVSKLMEITEQFLNDVWNSVDQCPIGLRKLFWFVRRGISRKAPEMQLAVLVNLFYLRFLVSTVLSPRLNSATLDANHKRTLGIICKIVLNLANGIPFGEKETYMLPLNAFITPQRKEQAIQFLQALTDMKAISDDQEAVGGEGGMRQWAMRCIQRALFANIDILWAKAMQNQQLGKVFQTFLSSSLCDS